MNKYLLPAVLLMAFMYSSSYSQRDPDRDRQKVNEPERDKPGQEILEDRRQPATMPKEPDRERPQGIPDRTPRPIEPPKQRENPPQQTYIPPAETPSEEYYTPTYEAPIFDPQPIPIDPYPTPKRPSGPIKHRGAAEELKIQGIQFFDNYDYRNALYCFMKALEIDSNDYDLYYYRGCAFLKLDKYVYAIVDLDYYLLYYAKDKDALYNRGLAKFFNNEKDEAYYDFQKAADLGDVRASSMLKRFY